MDLEKVRYLCDTAARLDYTVPNSKNISRNLREICVTRFCRFRLDDISELCPVCLTPWSSGRLSLRLRSRTKAVKKKSLAKLLRKNPSCLNDYQKALLDRIRRAFNVMKLTCLECKRVTKKYVTKPGSLGATSSLDETVSLDNVAIVTPEKPLVKKKRKKRKKDVMCGLKSSVIVKVRQSKSKQLNTSLKVDCDSQVLTSDKNDRCISERESNILTNSSNSGEFNVLKKLRCDDNDSDLSRNVNMKITLQETEKCRDQIKIRKINVHFEQNNFKSVAKAMSEANIQSNVSSSLTILKKTESRVDHLPKKLTDAPLNTEQETENNTGTNSSCDAATETVKATHRKHPIDENKQFKQNSVVTYDSFRQLECNSKPLVSVSEENNEWESCVTIQPDECTSESSKTDSCLINKSVGSNKTANNIKINLLSQPSSSNKLQSNVCTNLKKNKNQSNGLSSRHLNYANITNNNKNGDTRGDSCKQFRPPGNNLKPTKHKHSKGKKPTNCRLLNKQKQRGKVFEELTCRNSLCVKDLLTLT